VADAIRAGADRLRDVADNPRLEASLLLAHALGVTRADLIREPARMVDPVAYLALVERRRAHEPLAHLTGRREFWSLDLLVSPATLIPRADSETVVAAALRERPDANRILDLGTGSGCLLLALLSERPGAYGVGIDWSIAALRIARLNAQRCRLAGRVGLVAGDWTDAISEKFDLIVSNPPYIPTADIPGLMPEVAIHEPRAALDGGPDGLDAYRRIIAGLPRLLAPGGVAVLEIGVGQLPAVSALAVAAGFAAAADADLAGVPRAVILRRA
jgi:release factor glutamine methyltransferase